MKFMEKIVMLICVLFMLGGVFAEELSGVDSSNSEDFVSPVSSSSKADTVFTSNFYWAIVVVVFVLIVLGLFVWLWIRGPRNKWD
jgi:hypothetical protein